jgi:esterase/lipase/1-acyl-sn-glycerol-3-phosphate acyltransferase
MSNFLFGSSAIALGWLESLLGATIKIKGSKNIPTDVPLLFVANHFTRFETVILPYVINKEFDIDIRSLADESVLVGGLGSFIRGTGSVSTKDPARNEIILGDLMSNSASWLIYPEGVMLKNKHVTKEDDLYIVHEDERVGPVRTGAALLALQSELLKEEYHASKDPHFRRLFKEKYHMTDRKICDTPIQIIPINITYYPLRPGSNRLSQFVENRFKEDMNQRIVEELEIEGNAIVDGDINITFSAPIDICEYMEWFHSRFDSKTLLELGRNDLTTRFMQEVYENATLNIDHIVASILFAYPDKSITLLHLKKLVYLLVQVVRCTAKFHFHHSLKKKLYSLISGEENALLDSILNLAIHEGAITLYHDVITINHHQLEERYSFHAIRSKNLLMVLRNEVALLPSFVEQVDAYCLKSYDEVNEGLFEYLYIQAISEFENDHATFYDAELSKEKSIGRPFFLEAKKESSNTVGVVLVHGYKSAPAEVRALAESLHSDEVSVFALRLRGHGTAPHNLKELSWNDWYQSVLRAIAMMQQLYNKIVLVGFSTGGLLSLMAAAKHQTGIDGVVSINSALSLNSMRVSTVVPAVEVWNDLLEYFKTNKGQIESSFDEPSDPEVNYGVVYLRSLNELNLLMLEMETILPLVALPLLILQADNDSVVNPKSADIILHNAGSEDKKLIVFRSDVHNLKNPEVLKMVTTEIKGFISKLN